MLDPYVRRAELLSVTDGDTVRMVIDLGYRNFTETAIRLYQVNAPEIFRGTDDEKEKGQAAKKWVTEWFSNHSGKSDWDFLVRSYKDKKSFDRWIGEIYAANGDCLNNDIIDAGHALFEDY